MLCSIFYTISKSTQSHTYTKQESNPREISKTSLLIERGNRDCTFECYSYLQHRQVTYLSMSVRESTNIVNGVDESCF